MPQASLELLAQQIQTRVRLCTKSYISGSTGLRNMMLKWTSMGYQKSFLSIKDMPVQLRFAKLQPNKPQDFLNNVLWTDKTKVEMFGNAQCNALQKPTTATVKHGSGEVMMWPCSEHTGLEYFAVTESATNASAYQNILELNLRPSIQQLKIGRKWGMQQDNNFKHSNSLQHNGWKRKERCCNGPDLKLIEMLWRDLKRGPKCLHNDVRVINSWRKQLLKIIAAKCGSTSYSSGCT